MVNVDPATRATHFSFAAADGLNVTPAHAGDDAATHAASAITSVECNDIAALPSIVLGLLSPKQLNLSVGEGEEGGEGGGEYIKL